ncbi:MAG: hypothetical protein LBQ35_02755 [Spirochaetaceae bacterium]|nr:hypothetical protein [Spirochaetaceae bacterium]
MLNKVFHKSYKIALRGGYDIQPGKRVCFFCLAEKRPGGGWQSPEIKEDNPWLNIPDPDEKAFTQIQLNKTDDSFPKLDYANTDFAIFMLKKGATGRYAYHFYGVFKLAPANKNTGVWIYQRTSALLDIDQWAPPPSP